MGEWEIEETEILTLQQMMSEVMFAAGGSEFWRKHLTADLYLDAVSNDYCPIERPEFWFQTVPLEPLGPRVTTVRVSVRAVPYVKPLEVL